MKSSNMSFSPIVTDVLTWFPSLSLQSARARSAHQDHWPSWSHRRRVQEEVNCPASLCFNKTPQFTKCSRPLCCFTSLTNTPLGAPWWFILKGRGVSVDLGEAVLMFMLYLNVAVHSWTCSVGFQTEIWYFRLLVQMELLSRGNESGVKGPVTRIRVLGVHWIHLHFRQNLFPCFASEAGWEQQPSLYRMKPG